MKSTHNHNKKSASNNCRTGSDHSNEHSVKMRKTNTNSRTCAQRKESTMQSRSNGCSKNNPETNGQRRTGIFSRGTENHEQKNPSRCTNMDHDMNTNNRCMYNSDNDNHCNHHLNNYINNEFNNHSHHYNDGCNRSADHGPMPYVVNINQAAMKNKYFRCAIWTGSHLQTTLMCIPANEDIGFECHRDVDQMLVIVEGEGMVKMGPSRNDMRLRENLYPNCAIFVPAGTWHNILNTDSCKPLKLYSVYAPPNHPRGTVHMTKADAMAAER